VKKLKIALICGHVHRELPSLKYVARSLKKDLDADVKIIGSLAETQRTSYLLKKFSPHVVFISQIQEEVTRNLAEYLHNSGAVICVLTVEITYAKKNIDWYFNKRLSYTNLVDFFFVAGEEMYQDLLNITDLKKSQLFMVGSPKMDLNFMEAKKFMKRAVFMKKHGIDLKRKNLFIYTTFFGRSENYINKDESFKGNTVRAKRFYRAFRSTKKAYLKDLPKLARDFPNFNVIVKPHPLEDDRAYNKIKTNNLYVVQNESFNNTLDSVDLALHWNSTVSTECWIQGKKTVQYSPIRTYNDMLSEFRVGNPLLGTYPSLVKAIRKYTTVGLEKKYLEAQMNYLRNWYYKTDGKSGERIARVLSKKITKVPKVSYPQRYGLVYAAIRLLEKLVGVKLSRQMISLVKPNYRWRFAVNNYLPE